MVNTTDEKRIDDETDISYHNGILEVKDSGWGIYSTKDDYAELILPKKKKENIISYQRRKQNGNKV